jgi:hypothetical protein
MRGVGIAAGPRLAGAREGPGHITWTHDVDLIRTRGQGILAS